MSGKTAIVTGGAKGIGNAISERLVGDGFFVVIADTDKQAGEQAANRYGKENAAFIICNIASEKEVESLFKEVKKRYGRIDVLVNNAGIIRDRLIWNMSADDFDAVLNVNLRGSWLMCREAARLMKEQQQGRIVNIASRAWLGNAGQSNYSASKAGVVALTRVLALELGKYNILVNAVAPGLIDTPLTQGLDRKVLEKLVESQPTRSMGKPGDVAAVVSFLANESHQFITGQLWYVDGGKSIGASF